MALDKVNKKQRKSLLKMTMKYFAFFVIYHMGKYNHFLS